MERHTCDREYVVRLTGGDPEIERHFITHFGNLVSVKLRARLRSPQLIEDVRQTTLWRALTILRSDKGIDNPDRLGAFVNGVCENVLLEFLRKEGRYDQLSDGAGQLADQAASPESYLISEERKTLVRKALNKLSKDDQELLREVFFEQKDKDRICRDRKTNRDNLRVRIHRAIGRLRAAVGEGTQAAGAGHKA